VAISNSASPEIICGLGGPEEDHQLHHCCWTGRVGEREEEEDSMLIFGYTCFKKEDKHGLTASFAGLLIMCCLINGLLKPIVHKCPNQVAAYLQ